MNYSIQPRKNSKSCPQLLRNRFTYELLSTPNAKHCLLRKQNRWCEPESFGILWQKCIHGCKPLPEIPSSSWPFSQVLKALRSQVSTSHFVTTLAHWCTPHSGIKVEASVFIDFFFFPPFIHFRKLWFIIRNCTDEMKRWYDYSMKQAPGSIIMQ